MISKRVIDMATRQGLKLTMKHIITKTTQEYDINKKFSEGFL